MFLKRSILFSLLAVTSVLFSQCVTTELKNQKDKASNEYETTVQNKDDVLGIGILKRLPGLWNGPVTSTTPAGSFDTWYVDFRPVSPGQVSQYSTLDAQTQNFISFFIVRHDNKLKVAMRTEGVFQNKGCITYEVIDTVRESEGYYRFSDFQAGDKRAYTEFTFNEDIFIMEVYSSKFKTVYPLQLHCRWVANLSDRKATSEAILHFRFPQQIMIKDFTDVFKNMSESIYFTFENDPYSSLSQPYVGNVTVNISIDKNLKVDINDELFLLLTTESLFEGLKYKNENMKYISRYVYLPINTNSYTFKNIHPGKYYLYSYIDVSNDRRLSSGDYMSSYTSNILSLKENGSVIVDTRIDFIIP